MQLGWDLKDSVSFSRLIVHSDENSVLFRRCAFKNKLSPFRSDKLKTYPLDTSISVFAVFCAVPRAAGIKTFKVLPENDDNVAKRLGITGISGDLAKPHSFSKL